MSRDSGESGTSVISGSETVGRGRTAWVVPPGDADALAAALGPLLADPSAREALAARARVAASTLPTWDVQVAAFAAELAHALEAGR
jgi:glycosyltransferase involved in cell wall biosynthesis